MTRTENLNRLMQETLAQRNTFFLPLWRMSEVDITYLSQGEDMTLGLQCGLHNRWKMRGKTGTIYFAQD